MGAQGKHKRPDILLLSKSTLGIEFNVARAEMDRFLGGRWGMLGNVHTSTVNSVATLGRLGTGRIVCGIWPLDPRDEGKKPIKLGGSRAPVFSDMHITTHLKNGRHPMVGNIPSRQLRCFLCFPVILHLFVDNIYDSCRIRRLNPSACQWSCLSVKLRVWSRLCPTS
jgi:hypothetical protein